MSLADSVAHLTPEHWDLANRQLIRKALSEFAHERLLSRPVATKSRPFARRR